VVFASGSGTNFQAILDAVEAGQIPARISGLIASKKGIRAIERAKNHGVPYLVLKEKDFNSRDHYVQALLEQLETWNADLLVLAGFLKKVPAEVIDRYEGSILNLHPSLLPKYGGQGYFGKRVHEAVIENGETESGVTVHLVNEEYDDGPILAQEKVTVRSDDTPRSLAERIHKLEYELYPRVIAAVAGRMDR